MCAACSSAHHVWSPRGPQVWAAKYRLPRNGPLALTHGSEQRARPSPPTRRPGHRRAPANGRLSGAPRTTCRRALARRRRPGRAGRPPHPLGRRLGRGGAGIRRSRWNRRALAAVCERHDKPAAAARARRRAVHRPQQPGRRRRPGSGRAVADPPRTARDARRATAGTAAPATGPVTGGAEPGLSLLLGIRVKVDWIDVLRRLG